MPTILIVDDQPHIVELAQMYFVREGFEVVTAADGAEALAQVRRVRPDLMLLDLMLPRMDGWELCRRLREAGNTMPIIVLTARDDDVDKIVGLEMGADDYVTKPFNPREVVARARALLRRQGWAEQQPEVDGPLAAGPLVMDPATRMATLNDTPLTLRPREWALLEMLVRHAGMVRSREQLLDEVWGYDYYGDTRTVDVHIASLRDRLRGAGGAGVAIETVWGIGYKLVVSE